MAQEKLTVELVTPEQSFALEEVDSVIVPGSQGDFGVLHHHAPLISTLRAGAVSFRNNGKETKRFFVQSGFAEIIDKRCTILAEAATDLEDFNAKDAEKQLKQIKDDLDSNYYAEDKATLEHKLAYAESLLEYLKKK